MMKQPVGRHLQELQRRLMWSALVVLAGALVAYVFHEPLMAWLRAPLHQTLYYTKITGAFEFLMSACLLSGILAAIPVLAYNLVAFIQPALPQPLSHRQIAGIVAASTLLTFGGVAFGYYVTLPQVIHFLSHIGAGNLSALIAADSYLRFVVIYLGVFALIFQLPLILLAIDRITPLPPSRLHAFRKWIIIGAFGVCLILPIAPDPVSQCMLAVPIVVMFEFSTALLWFMRYRDKPARPEIPPKTPSPQNQRSAGPRTTQNSPRPSTAARARTNHPVTAPLGHSAPTPPKRPRPSAQWQTLSPHIIDLRNQP